MRPTQPLDGFALDVLRNGTEDFDSLLEHKQKHAPERFRNNGEPLPYMLVLVGSDREAKTFDVFMGSNVARDQARRFLLLLLAKIDGEEPTIREPVPERKCKQCGAYTTTAYCSYQCANRAAEE